MQRSARSQALALWMRQVCGEPGRNHARPSQTETGPNMEILLEYGRCSMVQMQDAQSPPRSAQRSAEEEVSGRIRAHLPPISTVGVICHFSAAEFLTSAPLVSSQPLLSAPSYSAAVYPIKNSFPTNRCSKEGTRSGQGQELSVWQWQCRKEHVLLSRSVKGSIPVAAPHIPPKVIVWTSSAEQ
jgi:hypothetical protein